MVRLYKCDRCERIVCQRAVRASVTVDVLNLPADDGFDDRREYFNADLCEGCLRELCEFLKMEVPE